LGAKDFGEYDDAEMEEAQRLMQRMAVVGGRRPSRRRVPTRQTSGRPDLARTVRRALRAGGEPIERRFTTHGDRLRRVVFLLDVSGSMEIYSRVFLAFLAGLMRADTDSDAYLFHTRLVRITEALRDKDTMRAVGRMSLMADGFGGGTKIGASLSAFTAGYARRFVDGRSVVLILSDGYDTSATGELGHALGKLRKRGCRIIWLNPLKGWRDYAPVAAGMAEALPHLDLFSAANTLGDLAALEQELATL